GPHRSGRGWAVGGGPWCRSRCRADGRVSWAGRRAGPWRRGRPGACRHGSPRRGGGGGARSRLAGHGGVAEGPGSRHTRGVAYTHYRRGGNSAALPRPQSRDQLEPDELCTQKAGCMFMQGAAQEPPAPGRRVEWKPASWAREPGRLEPMKDTWIGILACSLKGSAVGLTGLVRVVVLAVLQSHGVRAHGRVVRRLRGR